MLEVEALSKDESIISDEPEFSPCMITSPSLAHRDNLCDVRELN